MDDAELIETLTEVLGALSLPLPEGAASRFGQYLRLLDKWNRAWNLTAVRDLDAMVSRHLADSLSIRPWLLGERIADVGTGAGLPGIPLAIAEPAREFVLIDSAAKRTRFVTQAVALLGLENTRVVRSRAEDYHPDSAFGTVISRAFASLAGFVSAAGHLCEEGGQLLAMKGRYPGDEITALPENWRVGAVHELSVPGLAAERHLVIIRRTPVKPRV